MAKAGQGRAWDSQRRHAMRSHVAAQLQAQSQPSWRTACQKRERAHTTATCRNLGARAPSETIAMCIPETWSAIRKGTSRSTIPAIRKARGHEVRDWTLAAASTFRRRKAHREGAGKLSRKAGQDMQMLDGQDGDACGQHPPKAKGSSAWGTWSYERKQGGKHGTRRVPRERKEARLQAKG